MASAAPDPQKCRTAIKVLEQFERLAKKLRVRIRAKRLERLQGLRDAGTICSGDLPGTLTRRFPGEFLGMTLDEIRQHCGLE